MSHIRQYELLRELGAGRYGRVWLGTGEVPARGMQPGRRRHVAIKVLSAAAPDPEAERLLQQEFALLEQVKHRSIVRVFEYLPEHHAVVMEAIDGVTLRTVLDVCERAREPVFTEAALEIGCEVADALYQAWTTPADNGERLQLVHRDLKPENVMITRTGEVKVLDWGLARVDNADFAREATGRIRGTPVYMSPEQARGEEVDHRSDLFSLGLILYELLMGRPAYRASPDAADPLRALLEAIEGGHLTAQVRELEARLPGTGSIVARLLQPRPRGRYAHGHDLLVDLRSQLTKDRGAHLAEFCDFFFGSLHRLPPLTDAPAAPGSTGTPGGTMASDTPGRKSIEERLREREARLREGDGGEGVQRAPVPVRRAPSAAPPQFTPPPPAAPPAPAPPRAAMAPLTPPAPPPRAMHAPTLVPDDPPPSVKGAARTAPPPPAPGGRPPVGARSPDETGMLRMVPLSGDDDDATDTGDGSATAFFALPAPRAERPRGAPAAPPPGGARPPMQGPPGFAPPPPFAPPAGPPPGGWTQPPFAPPPAYGGPPAPPIVGGTPGMSGVGMSGAGMPGAIQGPVHGAPGAMPGMIQGPTANAGTPFAVSGPVPGGSSAGESRVQSARVWAILLGVFAVACAAVVVVVLMRTEKPEERPATPVAAAPAPAPTVKRAAREEDTGAPVAAAAAPAAKPKPRAAPAGGGGAAAPATPRAAPLGPKATLSVRFDGTAPAAIEVTCPSGFRQRASLAGGAGSVPDVPTGEACTMYPKGIPATNFPVRGGKSLTCTIQGTTTSCK